MTRSLYSSYYKGVVADENFYLNLNRLIYNEKEFIV